MINFNKDFFSNLGGSNHDLSTPIDIAVSAASKTKDKKLYFDSGTYNVKSPIFIEADGIKIVGNGDSTLFRTNGACSSVFAFGLRKIKDGSNRIPIKNKLKMNIFKEQMYAIKTGKDSFIQFQASPFSDGKKSSVHGRSSDHWEEIKEVSFDIAISNEEMTGNIPSYTSIFAIGVGSNENQNPFVLYTTENNCFVFKYRCVDYARNYINKRIEFELPKIKNSVVRKICIQISFITKTYSVYCGDDTEFSRIAFGSIESNIVGFCENTHYPMLIGDGGGNRPDYGNTTKNNFILCGFSITDGIRINQELTSHTSYSDYIYFVPNKNTIALIDMNYVNARNYSLIRYLSGESSDKKNGFGYLLKNDLFGMSGIKDNSISDFSVESGHMYGQCISLSHVLDFRAKNIRTKNGYHGIGSFSHGANYIIYVENCRFDSSDSGYFGLNQIIRCRDLHFDSSGRNTISLVGCVGDIDGAFVGFHSSNSQTTVSMFAGDYGGNYSIKNMHVNYEGGFFKKCGIYAQIHPYTPVTTVMVKDTYFGTMGKVPIFLGDDLTSAKRRGIIRLDNVIRYDSPPAGGDAVGSSEWSIESIRSESVAYAVS